ncbi:hypothetical protein MKW98_012703 [Papaver atlanticum]|uniref:WASH complex subunit 7 central domain-containing protein n=1 Tax=Papaver atlanticum TaxID=357466 RepID=A0AAD4XM94_9MAGN|nr:hypothetical protein MKW98_012703 [Papaver atlanticum]
MKPIEEIEMKKEIEQRIKITWLEGTGAAEWGYRLVFIKKASSNHGQKASTVFGMDNVVSSITTHGFGMTSAAVNSVLNFVTQKIVALPEFLQENFVNSISRKDLNILKISKKNYKWLSFSTRG